MGSPASLCQDVATRIHSPSVLLSEGAPADNGARQIVIHLILPNGERSIGVFDGNTLLETIFDHAQAEMRQPRSDPM